MYERKKTTNLNMIKRNHSRLFRLGRFMRKYPRLLVFIVPVIDIGSWVAYYWCRLITAKYFRLWLQCHCLISSFDCHFCLSKCLCFILTEQSVSLTHQKRKKNYVKYTYITLQQMIDRFRTVSCCCLIVFYFLFSIEIQLWIEQYLFDVVC